MRGARAIWRYLGGAALISFVFGCSSDPDLFFDGPEDEIPAETNDASWDASDEKHPSADNPEEDDEGDEDNESEDGGGVVENEGDIDAGADGGDLGDSGDVGEADPDTEEPLNAIGNACKYWEECGDRGGYSADQCMSPQGICTRYCESHDDCDCPEGMTTDEVLAGGCPVGCFDSGWIAHCLRICNSDADCEGTSSCWAGNEAVSYCI